MKRCVIVGAGEIYGRVDIKDGDFVIAADGGYEHLARESVVPDVLVGDFDSIDSLPFIEDARIVRYPVEKDETDMYLAYRIGAQNGCDEFYIYGGTGGREDHTFANYCLLLDAINDKNRVYLIGDTRKIFVIKNEKIELDLPKNKTVSVFAFGSDASGVTIKGLKYEAKNITLKASFPLGVSNSTQYDATRAEISVKDGTLLIMVEL